MGFCRREWDSSFNLPACPEESGCHAVLSNICYSEQKDKTLLECNSLPFFPSLNIDERWRGSIAMETTETEERWGGTVGRARVRKDTLAWFYYPGLFNSRLVM